MQKTLILATVCAVAISAATPAMAANAGAGGNAPWWDVASWFVDEDKGRDRILRDHFTSEDKAVIRTVFDEVFGDNNENTRTTRDKSKKGGGAKSMPPGLAKRDRLPPGLEKQIQETGTLPPGLAKRDLPDDLKRRLPRIAKGQEVIWVEDDVYLIETATRAVLDVVKDVLK